MIAIHDTKKNNCPWIKDLKVNSKILKVLGECHFGHRVRKDPLHKPPKLKAQGRDC